MSGGHHRCERISSWLHLPPTWPSWAARSAVGQLLIFRYNNLCGLCIFMIKTLFVHTSAISYEQGFKFQFATKLNYYYVYYAAFPNFLPYLLQHYLLYENIICTLILVWLVFVCTLATYASMKPNIVPTNNWDPVNFHFMTVIKKELLIYNYFINI
jgi:hypothetical protein